MSKTDRYVDGWLCRESRKYGGMCLFFARDTPPCKTLGEWPARETAILKPAMCNRAGVHLKFGGGPIRVRIRMEVIEP